MYCILKTATNLSHAGEGTSDTDCSSLLTLEAIAARIEVLNPVTHLHGNKPFGPTRPEHHWRPGTKRSEHWWRYRRVALANFDWPE